METWPGARNLADLGGLPTVAGATTATGRIWRSAASEWMTAAGWSAARGAGLTTVVDLRNIVSRQAAHESGLDLLNIGLGSAGGHVAGDPSSTARALPIRTEARPAEEKWR